MKIIEPLFLKSFPPSDSTNSVQVDSTNFSFVILTEEVRRVEGSRLTGFVERDSSTGLGMTTKTGNYKWGRSRSWEAFMVSVAVEF